jgi:hypothetical protein
MKVGFTGTREGMTTRQYATFVDKLEELYSGLVVREWHDGDCVGADDEAHNYASSIPGVYLHLHPSNLFRQRAYNTGDFEYGEMPPLMRNKKIVDSVDVMIATPSGETEIMRGSGTWATIRYARKVGIRLIIIWPSGQFIEENG